MCVNLRNRHRELECQICNDEDGHQLRPLLGCACMPKLVTDSNRGGLRQTQKGQHASGRAAETTRDAKLRRRVITRIAATPWFSCGASTPQCKAVWCDVWFGCLAPRVSGRKEPVALGFPRPSRPHDGMVGPARRPAAGAGPGDPSESAVRRDRGRAGAVTHPTTETLRGRDGPWTGPLLRSSPPAAG